MWEREGGGGCERMDGCVWGRKYGAQEGSLEEALCKYAVGPPVLPVFTVEGGDAGADVAQARLRRGNVCSRSKCRIVDARLGVAQGLGLVPTVHAPGSHVYIDN